MLKNQPTANGVIQNTQNAMFHIFILSLPLSDWPIISHGLNKYMVCIHPVTFLQYKL